MSANVWLVRVAWKLPGGEGSNARTAAALGLAACVALVSCAVSKSGDSAEASAAFDEVATLCAEIDARPDSECALSLEPAMRPSIRISSSKVYGDDALPEINEVLMAFCIADEEGEIVLIDTEVPHTLVTECERS